MTTFTLDGEDVCVPTQDERTWPQADFAAWMDAIKRQHGLGSDFALAQHWGIGHTLISGWRSTGQRRQRPSFETLNRIAAVEGIDARHLWVLAGLVTPAEVGLLDDASSAALRVLPDAVIELLDLLDDPRLDAAGRDQLLATVRVLVAGTRASLPDLPSPRRPGRKAS